MFGTYKIQLVTVITIHVTKKKTRIGTTKWGSSRRSQTVSSEIRISLCLAPPPDSAGLFPAKHRPCFREKTDCHIKNCVRLSCSVMTVPV